MTQTNIPKERRLFIKHIVAEACEYFNNPKLPVEIKAFARSYCNIRLISYSKHMKHIDVPYEYLVSIAKDSYTDYYADINMYYIYYNDIDYNITNSNRYRWNIAHELGHVLLGHLRDNQMTRLTRPALPESEYLYLEEEADYFAQLVLVPHSALWGFNIQNSNHIKLLCKISGPASRKRMYEYNAWKHNGQPLDDYDNRILKYYYSYVYKKKCKTCGAGIIQQYGKHCPICGSKNTLEWGDGEMNYKKYLTNNNGSLKECIQCNNEEILGDFCHICGAPAKNYCSDYYSSDDDYSCRHSEPLPGNARYCPACGSESTFYKHELLPSWEIEFDELIAKDNYDNAEPVQLVQTSLFDTIPSNIFEDDDDEELPFN